MPDTLTSGRRSCILNIVDDHTCGALAIELDNSLLDLRVVWVLVKWSPFSGRG